MTPRDGMIGRVGSFSPVHCCCACRVKPALAHGRRAFCVPSGRRHAWTPRYYFAVPKSLTQSLIVGSVAFEEAGAHRTILRTDPARVRHGIAGGVGSRWQTVENRVPSWRRCCLYSQRARPRKIPGRKIMARYSGLPATRSNAGQFKCLASQFNEFGQ